MKRPGQLLELIRNVILWGPRRQMRKSMAKKIRVMLSTIQQGHDLKHKLSNYECTDVLQMLAASDFCLMLDLDISILTRDMACQKNWWESRLYGRLLAMTILECVEDVPTVLGKSFRESLQKASVREELRKKLEAISKRLSNFRRDNESTLRNIRKIAAAHRDHDPNTIVRVVEDLDIRELTLMAGKVMHEFGELAGVMASIFDELNVFLEMLKGLPKGKIDHKE